jgi:hypothetical protein
MANNKKVTSKTRQSQQHGYGSEIYIAVAEIYDGGIGIFNKSFAVAAYFDKVAAERAAAENSTGMAIVANGFIRTHKIMDKCETKNPQSIFVAYGVESGGGQCRDKVTELGAYFSEATARKTAKENSNGPWYENCEGRVEKYTLLGK